jgi:hypothetical protein
MGGRLNASSILFQDTELSPGLFRIDYIMSGIVFQANEALELNFDASLYTQLQNGVAGAGFDLLLIQPNNPGGAPGLYSALALTGPLTPTGTFSVDAVMSGQSIPGPQQFQLNQYDTSGMFVETVDSGVTASSVPEPGTLPLNMVVLLIGGIAGAVRRRT